MPTFFFFFFWLLEAALAASPWYVRSDPCPCGGGRERGGEGGPSPVRSEGYWVSGEAEGVFGGPLGLVEECWMKEMRKQETPPRLLPPSYLPLRLGSKQRPWCGPSRSRMLLNREGTGDSFSSRWGCSWAYKASRAPGALTTRSCFPWSPTGKNGRSPQPLQSAHFQSFSCR